MGGDASVQTSLLSNILNRINGTTGMVADLASGLNNQADRLLGSPPPSPAPAPSNQSDKMLGGSPLVTQINEALRSLQTQVERVGVGANRLGELG